MASMLKIHLKTGTQELLVSGDSVIIPRMGEEIINHNKEYETVACVQYKFYNEGFVIDVYTNKSL